MSLVMMAARSGVQKGATWRGMLWRVMGGGSVDEIAKRSKVIVCGSADAEGDRRRVAVPGSAAEEVGTETNMLEKASEGFEWVVERDVIVQKCVKAKEDVIDEGTAVEGASALGVVEVRWTTVADARTMEHTASFVGWGVGSVEPDGSFAGELFVRRVGQKDVPEDVGVEEEVASSEVKSGTVVGTVKGLNGERKVEGARGGLFSGGLFVNGIGDIGE